MRPAGSFLSIAALFWAFMQAPFLHVHPFEEDHPAASVVHLHNHRGQQTDSPAIGIHTPDEDAIDQDWHIAPPPTFELAVSLPIASLVIDPPATTATAPVFVTRPRGHDPPDLSPKQPRSPPA